MRDLLRLQVSLSEGIIAQNCKNYNVILSIYYIFYNEFL